MATTLIDTLDQIINDGKSRNLIHRISEDHSIVDSTVTLDNRKLINFGSCSYLGIERHESLKQGAMDAIQRYGTQFSSSRAFLSLSLYEELESLVSEMFGQPAVVTATTTLGHLATLPTIIGDNDAIILDLQVHSSIQMTVQMLKARNIPVHIIRHNAMDALENKIKTLKEKHDKVWFLCDGVYSIYGDYVPVEELKHLLDKYEQFYAYVDDAHGMGWTGKNGTGVVRKFMEHHERMVMAVSLNKSFAAAGGAIIFPNQEMYQKVRNCGSTMIFSGPIQPPMLGAAIASAKLHLSDEINDIQDHLMDLIHHTNNRIEELGLPVFARTESPLFFVPTGLPQTIYNVVNRMLAEGFYVNAASFPATPMKQGGIRFMINGNLTKDQIDAMLEKLAWHFPLALAEEGISPQELAKSFGIPEFKMDALAIESELPSQSASEALSVEVHRSIRDLDHRQWDKLFAGRGNMSTSCLISAEEVFTKQERPQDNWDFCYFTVKDQNNHIVLTTFYTTAEIKDDMFAPGYVSEQIEETRKNDPSYLCSKSVMLGSMITKGEHLHLDRTHPQWKKALKMLVDQMQQTLHEAGAAQLMLREFAGEVDEELKTTMLELGLTHYELPEVSVLENLDWKDEAEYLQRLGSRYRYDLRKEVLRKQDLFDVSTTKPQTAEELDYCYQLYSEVQEKAFEMNVKKLPKSFFEEAVRNPEYDIIRLYLREEANNPDRKPVAVMFSFAGSVIYNALIVGLDYRYVTSLGTYKQILYRTVVRARELENKTLDLAFTATQVKKKVGARPRKVCAFMQVMDHFNMAVISNITRRQKSRVKV